MPSKFSDDEIFHMKRELGDVLWYCMAVQGCIALGFTPEEVMQENINKLEKRYPNGFELVIEVMLARLNELLRLMIRASKTSRELGDI